MAVFKCKICGGALEINSNVSVAVCEYCGTKQTLPKLDNNQRASLYEHANHYRRNNDYDKAMSIYENILSEDSTDAEAYWSLVLCRFGIVYVEDPASHKRVPTVNRAQFTSVYDDDNYKSALKYADLYQKPIYEAEANAIYEIQKNILEISQKEEPFDVFICFKETDTNGRQTPDSMLANDLYHQLTQEGFKVFLLRINFEDKLWNAYEPYIFAALNSSKVMVVIGTQPEYFNAVWVKNEWSRYLALVKQSDGKKVLIPAYRDMNPYNLPEEFSNLQAQDMSKLGFMPDLIRGIKKIVGADTHAAAAEETAEIGSVNPEVAPILKRAFMYLEDGNWDYATSYCDRVLDRDPENAVAYLGKLMAETKVNKQDALMDCADPFDESNNYQKAIHFGNIKLKADLQGYTDHIKKRIEHESLRGIYNNAVHEWQFAKTENEYRYAAKLFKSVSGYRDADAKEEECRKIAENMRLERERKAEEVRNAAKKARKQAILITAVAIPLIVACIAFIIVIITVIIPVNNYNIATDLYNAGKYDEAAELFVGLGEYRDSHTLKYNCLSECGVHICTLSAGDFHTVGLYPDGTVVAVGSNHSNQCDISRWRDIVAVSAGEGLTAGLKVNGTVVAVGNNFFGQCDVSGWRDIVAVSAGASHIAGLKSNGTVVAAGSNNDKQCSVSGWTHIVSVAVGYNNTVGLKADGTVVAVGSNAVGQCCVFGWKDIKAVSAGGSFTVGLKADGTVIAVGSDSYGQCDVSDWTDIVAVSAGEWHTVGLKADGTVVSVGNNDGGQCDVSGWRDIVAVSAGGSYTVGLKADGTVIAAGSNESGQCDVSHWSDIAVPPQE